MTYLRRKVERKILELNYRSFIPESKLALSDGEWPSGKALVFGTSIRGFESLLPSQGRKKGRQDPFAGLVLVKEGLIERVRWSEATRRNYLLVSSMAEWKSVRRKANVRYPFSPTINLI
jgi:hypothetical protein